MSPSQAGDVEEARVGGDAVAAEHAKVGLRRRQVEVELRERAEAAERRPARFDSRVVAPAAGVPHRVAWGESLGADLTISPTVTIPSISRSSSNGAE
jgi:hypothetical protein